MHDVSVSTIILITDDKKLNEKGMEENRHLEELHMTTQGRLKLNISAKVIYI